MVELFSMIPKICNIEQKYETWNNGRGYNDWEMIN